MGEAPNKKPLIRRMRGCVRFSIVFYVRNVISTDALEGLVIVVIRVIIVPVLNTSIYTACTTPAGYLSNRE
jgi:hypothetical protein